MRYQVSIALTRNDFDRLQKLQKAKIKVVSIFRAGLTAVENNEKTNTKQTNTKQEGTQ